MNIKIGNEINMVDVCRVVVCLLIEGFIYDLMFEVSRFEDWSLKFLFNK